MSLPFRDESFDAVLSIAVVHHFATVERRAMALRELARITRIGGRLLLTVWAMEHEGRNFHSQVYILYFLLIKYNQRNIQPSINKNICFRMF